MLFASTTTLITLLSCLASAQAAELEPRWGRWNSIIRVDGPGDSATVISGGPGGQITIYSSEPPRGGGPKNAFYQLTPQSRSDLKLTSRGSEVVLSRQTRGPNVEWEVMLAADWGKQVGEPSYTLRNKGSNTFLKAESDGSYNYVLRPTTLRFLADKWTFQKTGQFYIIRNVKNPRFTLSTVGFQKYDGVQVALDDQPVHWRLMDVGRAEPPRPIFHHRTNHFWRGGWSNDNNRDFDNRREDDKWRYNNDDDDY